MLVTNGFVFIRFIHLSFLFFTHIFYLGSIPDKVLRDPIDVLIPDLSQTYTSTCTWRYRHSVCWFLWRCWIEDRSKHGINMGSLRSEHDDVNCYILRLYRSSIFCMTSVRKYGIYRAMIDNVRTRLSDYLFTHLLISFNGKCYGHTHFTHSRRQTDTYSLTLQNKSR